jgi:hypothetical protein
MIVRVYDDDMNLFGSYDQFVLCTLEKDGEHKGDMRTIIESGEGLNTIQAAELGVSLLDASKKVFESARIMPLPMSLLKKVVDRGQQTEN